MGAAAAGAGGGGGGAATGAGAAGASGALSAGAADLRVRFLATSVSLGLESDKQILLYSLQDLCSRGFDKFPFGLVFCW